MAYCDYWNKSSEVDKKYHDTEWGIPIFDDKKHFEFLMLEVMQCGLSWSIVINKREIFRKCFDNFDYDLIAKYKEKDIKRILNTVGMIKSIKKIEAIINNAKCFQKVISEYGSFSKYIWDFSGSKTIIYDKHPEGYIPASNGLSEKISKDLKKRGFKFLGAVTVYSYLQATGIINDHDKNCPMYDYINSNFSTIKKHRDFENGVICFQ